VAVPAVESLLPVPAGVDASLPAAIEPMWEEAIIRGEIMEEAVTMEEAVITEEVMALAVSATAWAVLVLGMVLVATAMAAAVTAGDTAAVTAAVRTTVATTVTAQTDQPTIRMRWISIIPRP